MSNNIIKQLESIFRDSTSADELFDALNLAIENKICETDLYKILLANSTLSNDEIMMFTEKLCEQCKECRFDLYYWTGYLFHLKDKDYSLIEDSLYYYQKAFLIKPEDSAPLLAALKLYNYEFDLPANKNILHLVNTGAQMVSEKSGVYTELARHYKKTGNLVLSRKFSMLSEQSSRNKNQ